MKRFRIMKLSICLGLTFLVSAVWSPPYAAQTEIPLVVIDEYYDSEAGTLRFSLENQGDKLITAWGFLITTGDGLGNEQISGLAEDHVKSPHLDPSFVPLPGPERSRPLGPGDMTTYERRIALDGDPTYHVVSVEVTFVIFDDASAMGDPREIEFRYQDRLGELDAIEIFLDLVETSISDGRPSEDLLTAVEEAEARARTEYEQISSGEKTSGTRHARIFSKAGQFRSLLASLQGSTIGRASDPEDARETALEYRTLLLEGIPEQMLALH